MEISDYKKQTSTELGGGVVLATFHAIPKSTQQLFLSSSGVGNLRRATIHQGSVFSEAGPLSAVVQGRLVIHTHTHIVYNAI